MVEVQRLDDLVREFLRYARPHEPDLRATVLSDVVERAFALLRVEAERARVALVADATAPLPDVYVDPAQIEQVLLNVVLNAIQASAPGASVRVREHLEGQTSVIDVIDEGPGIPDQNVSQVFSPFFTTREKGTGLGLAIASRIVLEHRGTLEIHDTSERGTCVRIRLPVDDSTRRHETVRREPMEV
jgi:signal transduction histidine kinase